LLLPPSTKPENNFISLTSSNNQGNFDSCQLSIAGIQPNIFSLFTISKATVQSISSLRFNLKSSAVIQSTDAIVIQFDPVFNLSSLGSTVTFAGIGTFPVIKSGNIAKISSISK
jgi:hypothetical protein